MSILEVPIIVALTAVIIYELCISFICIVNLHRLTHGKVKVVTSLREYIKYSRRTVK